MDNRAGEMQIFLRVIEAGNFSEAARRLRMTPSTISKLISRTEARLGVRLLERSTRRLALTDEGRIYYERSVALLAALEEAERELSQGAANMGGVVRINASVAFGVVALEPLLPAFWRAYPHIIVDLSLSDEIVDLYLERTDIAFRVGPLSDSSMTTRRIGVARRKIVAAPAYLAARGTPASLDDLSDHDRLGFNFRRSAPDWPLPAGGRIVDSAVRGPLLANNGETVRRIAIAGAGLARLSEYHVRRDIAEGRLVEVLAQAIPEEEVEIHALFLGGERMPHRVRAFLDFMTPLLQGFLRG